MIILRDKILLEHSKKDIREGKFGLLIKEDRPQEMSSTVVEGKIILLGSGEKLEWSGLKVGDTIIHQFGAMDSFQNIEPYIDTQDIGFFLLRLVDILGVKRLDA